MRLNPDSYRDDANDEAMEYKCWYQEKASGF